MKPRQIVDEMDSYVPGRSQDEIAEEFNLNKDDIIKLGSNENPWGPSPKAVEAIKKEIHGVPLQKPLKQSRKKLIQSTGILNHSLKSL